MVQEYFVARVRELARKRAAERGSIRTRSDVFELRARVRRKVRACFGARPRKTPLNARVTGRVKRRDYAIEKVIYESRPGLLVSANLYLPHREGPLPAVLSTCGHAGDGKAYKLYQAFARNLARLGFVVLIYDPLSQGERIQYAPRDGLAKPRGCCWEHNMMGNQMALVGDAFCMWRTWDGIRGLDYLLSRAEVDPTRVGVTGNSGGGTMTTYLTGMDDRFTMAAPSCFVTTYLADLENELPADSEQIPPGIIAAGLDHADFFVAQIPRPTLILGQENDYFDVRGTTQTYEELRRLYAILGQEDKVQLFIGPRSHGYHPENREAMYRFFCKHAAVRGDVAEPRRPVEKQETLFATPKGQVGKEGSTRVFDFTSKTARDVATERGRVSPAELRKRIPRVLALPERSAVPHYRILRPTLLQAEREYQCTRLAVETEPGIQAILMRLGKDARYGPLPRGRQATLYVPHVSTIDDAKAGLTPKGRKTWFAVDVRGLGHTRARTCNDSDFFEAYDTDYFYASHGDMLDEPYAGRRVHDLLATLDLLADRGYRDIHLVGRGLGAVTCAFAACLHAAVKRVTLRNTLLSCHELTQVPLQYWPRSALIRGLLKHFDLPDCYRMLRSRKLAILEPWNARMKPWQAGALRSHLKALGLRVTPNSGRVT